MPKITTQLQWNPAKHSEYNLPKSVILFTIPQDQYMVFRGDMARFKQHQDNKGQLETIQTILEYANKPKSYQQIKTMWYLYKIMAELMNGGKIGSDAITPDQLYQDDLQENAPRSNISVDIDNADCIRETYKYVEHESELGNGMRYFVVIISASMWSMRYMSKWIDMLFNRLAEMGVDTDTIGSIIRAWQEWRGFLNKKNIELHEGFSKQQYKNAVKICEGCGCYLGDGSGQLAHIVSVGSGGADKPENWLHLCNKCHIETQHQKGWEYFIKLFPHTKNKIKSAQNKEN